MFPTNCCIDVNTPAILVFTDSYHITFWFEDVFFHVYFGYSTFLCQGTDTYEKNPLAIGCGISLSFLLLSSFSILTYCLCCLTST